MISASLIRKVKRPVDKDQLATAAVIAVVLIGIPMGLLALAVKSGEPKDRPQTLKENYPDDHFFI